MYTAEANKDRYSRAPYVLHLYYYGHEKSATPAAARPQQCRGSDACSMDHWLTHCPAGEAAQEDEREMITAVPVLLNCRYFVFEVQPAENRKRPWLEKKNGAAVSCLPLFCHFLDIISCSLLGDIFRVYGMI